MEDPPLSLLPPISSSTSSASALPSAAASVASRVARLPCGGGCGVNALAWDVRADKVLLLGTRGRGIKVRVGLYKS